MRQNRRAFVAIFFLLCSAGARDLKAQYFGRNKVVYEKFDFRVLQTPHFDIYHYLQNENTRNRMAALVEQWYLLHQSILKDSFRERNPIILYAHHGHFQQTWAISGEIGVGTGGVTEALKNRVIMPIMESNTQTSQVLGHELVHAFQYHLVKDSFSLGVLNNLPLWMVEGMAEYMSIGPSDPHTAMWLRSAVAAGQLPSLKDLTNRPDLYFPYRWGQAFWAYITGIHGDGIIRPLFLETARRGLDQALKLLLQTDEKTISAQWQQSLRNSYQPLMAGTQAPPGSKLVDKENGGELNIVPSISPDGKYLAYWTEKNLLSLDLYIAEVATGKNIERVTSTRYNSHIDRYSSYESSVAWSPDSRQLAFVVFAKGRNRLVLAGIDGKINQTIDIPGVTGFSNPAWSPDGKTIVVTGLVDGQSDLYAYDLLAKKTRRLTSGPDADLMPSFSPDGRRIVFATDRQGREGHGIALLDLSTGHVTSLEIFEGASNLDPVFGPGGQSVYFLSDRDGFRNLYRYELDSRKLLQLSDVFSGISGITPYAPAISLSLEKAELVYSYFSNGDYIIYHAPLAALAGIEVPADGVSKKASRLPPFARQKKDLVRLPAPKPGLLQPEGEKFRERPYESRFGLDYIGNTGVGLQTGGVYGTGLAGGVNGIFSDMLGRHQLYGAVSLNGELVDVAGQFAYFNQERRFNWGAGLSHIPYLSGAQYLFPDTIGVDGDSLPVLNSSLDLLRTFQDQATVFGSYPFSAVRRVEAGLSFSRYYYRLDRYTEYFDETGRFFLGTSREKKPVPKGFSLGRGYVALVSDNSFFGVASPLDGHRMRLEYARYIGGINMNSVLADYRKYFRIAPFTVATRNMFIGRYGEDEGTGLLPPLFIGYPSLIRGYDALEYADNAGSGSKITINDLIGKRIYIANVELRFPFTGPEGLSAIKSHFIFTELNLFTDAGLAWGGSSFLETPVTAKEQLLRRNGKLVLSSGLSLRLNLFGYLVIEPYYAIPWQNGGWKGANFGINLMPGF